MGIEKEVRERINVLKEQRTESFIHEAQFEIDDVMPRDAGDDPAVAAGDDAEEPLYVAEKLVTRYKVTYAPVTKFGPEGDIVERREKLSVEFDAPMLYARTIFKPVTLNGGRYVPATALKVEDSKIVEPAQRKEIYVGELDELVVEGLRKIRSQEIQEALGSYITGYSENRRE